MCSISDYIYLRSAIFDKFCPYTGSCTWAPTVLDFTVCASSNLQRLTHLLSLIQTNWVCASELAICSATNWYLSPLTEKNDGVIHHLFGGWLKNDLFQSWMKTRDQNSGCAVPMESSPKLHVSWASWERRQWPLRHASRTVGSPSGDVAMENPPHIYIIDEIAMSVYGRCSISIATFDYRSVPHLGFWENGACKELGWDSRKLWFPIFKRNHFMSTVGICSFGWNGIQSYNQK